MGQGGGPEALPHEDQTRELGTLIKTGQLKCVCPVKCLKTTCNTELCTWVHRGDG